MTISEWDCGAVQPCNGTLSHMEHCHVMVHCPTFGTVRIIYINHTGGAVLLHKCVHMYKSERTCVWVSLHCGNGLFYHVLTTICIMPYKTTMCWCIHTVSSFSPQLTPLLELRSNPHRSTRYLITGRLPPATA